MQTFWTGEITLTSLKLGTFLNCELPISNECAITTVINSLQHSINASSQSQILMLTTQNVSIPTTWAFIMGVNTNYLQAVNSNLKEPRINQKRHVQEYQMHYLLLDK